MASEVIVLAKLTLKKYFCRPGRVNYWTFKEFYFSSKKKSETNPFYGDGHAWEEKEWLRGFMAKLYKGGAANKKGNI